jgi:diacylglycerol kinase family enzyme
MTPQPGTFAPSFILNGQSIHLAEAQAAIARVSAELGVQAEVVVTRRGDDMMFLARQTADKGRRPIIAGGGDGSVSAVAAALAGTDVALGVLPMGTHNHFAKDAGIPLNLEAAVRNALAGQIARVDMGEVNGRVFVNNSGLGFYPHFVRQREEQERRGRVKPAAFMIALRSVVRRYFCLRLKAQEALFVGSNRYQTSGLGIGTRSRLDSARPWVCTAPRAGHRHVLRIALKALIGRETEGELNAFETKELWVDPGTPRANVSTDGEVSVMDTPLRFGIRPRALRVTAPASVPRPS